MSTPDQKTGKTPEYSQPQIPDISPSGLGHPLHNFMQVSMELQKSISEVKASVDGLARKVDSIGTKVDDLIKWKHMIIGGAIVIGFIIATVGWLYKEFKDDYVLKAKSEVQPVAVAEPAEPPPKKTKSK